jgi:DNA polymerase gamma 1
MASLGDSDATSPSSLAYIKAQISSSDKELRDIVKPLSGPRAPRKRKSKAEEMVDDVENEEEEISQTLLRYEQMARLIPVDTTWSGHGNSGIWNHHQIHPRSVGRAARA